MIEMGKKYRTRDGREVRIYAVDHAGPNSVMGAVKMSEGWCTQIWPIGGIFGGGDPFDLVEVRPEVTVTKSIIKERFGAGISMTIPDVNLPNWPNLGLINITHDGQNLIRVEIVK